MLRLWMVTCATLMSGSHCFEWLPDAPLDSAVKYTCTGSAAILPWAVSVQPGEEIGEVRWVLAGQSDEVVAVLSQGTFSPMPAFSGRVTHVPNAGLALAHVTPADTGNYSVQVTGRNSAGDQMALRRSAFLHVLDGPMTADGRLHGAQSPVAAFSNSTQQWHAVLTCGTFTEPPAFDLQWTTPSGEVLPSTQYSNGQFLLLLDNPVTAGSYTCKVPQAFASSACIHGNNEQAGEATISIDSTESRLLALEAQQRALLAENMELKERLAHMELNHTEHTGQSLHNDSALVQQVQDLGQQLQLQQQQVQGLEEQLQERNQSRSDLEQLQQQNQNSSGLHQQVQDLEQQLHHQRRQVKDLGQLLQQQQLNNSDLYQQVRDLGQRLDQQNQNNSHLYQQVQDLEQQLQQLSQGGTTPRISFHAAGLMQSVLQTGQTLILPQVYSNRGNAYSPVTGRFQAPVNGTYFFAASTETENSVVATQNVAEMSLVVDGAFVHFVNTRGNFQAGTVHAVLELRVGQQVWLNCYGPSYFWDQPTAFSGFLVYSEP